MHGRSRHDAYRRPFALIALLLSGLAVFLIGYAFVHGVGSRPDRPRWGEALVRIAALELLLGFYMSVLLVAPRVRADERDGVKLLRVPRWRRLTMGIGWPGIVGWPLAAWAFMRGDIVPGAVVVCLTSSFTAVLLMGTRDILSFDAFGIRRSRGSVEKGWIGWDEVRAVHVLSTAVRVDGNGFSIPIPGLLLDGYPEFVKELLARVLATIIDASTGARPTLERIAALTK